MVGTRNHQISYRKTGVMLSCKNLTACRSGFVDYRESRKTKRAVPGDDCGSNPTFANRSLSTLHHCGWSSVTLRWLISSTTGATSNGVPILGKTTLIIGKLFEYWHWKSRPGSDAEWSWYSQYLNCHPAEAEQPPTPELQKARIDKHSIEAFN